MARRHHTPRSAGPLLTADQALAVIELTAAATIEAETICLLTDDARRPLSCLVVEGGGLPDDVFPVAELLRELHGATGVAYVVLTSCRPGYAFDDDDIQRWHELAEGFAETGIELTEWFIRDDRLVVAVTPLAGEVSRWPGR